MKRQSDINHSSDPKSPLEEESHLDGLQSSGKRRGPSLDVRVPSLRVVANGGSEPTFEHVCAYCPFDTYNRLKWPRIIAVPGLGADPCFTWTKKVDVSPPEPLERRDAAKTKAEENAEVERAHLLLLLKQVFPTARILCYVDNSAWFREPIVKTPREIGIRLQEQIKAKRLSSRLPVIFIGHSLGGLIIKEALCADLSRSIIDDTVGIIFLGTPHQGARIVKAAALLAPIPKLFGLVDDTLIKYLTEHNCALSNLADSFDKLRSRVQETHHKIQIIAFYETKVALGYSKPVSASDLEHWLLTDFLRLVSRDSATVHADAFEKWPVNTDHSNLNKCSGVQDSYFVDLTKAIARLRCPSRLQLADSMIHNQHYNTDRLKITRLSGHGVDLSHCYINLAIEQEPFGQESAYPEKRNTRDTSFPLEEVDNLDISRELDLKTIFDQRKGRGGAMISPRKIMIRGRAGVGKSTLCKKIVHDFVHDETWRELFHRILWIPLRHLARTDRMMSSGYCLMSLFKDEFFPEHHELAEELAQDWSSKRGKTLFVLDGLDEVSQVLESERSGMKDFIKRLLEQPNLIITSRSHISHPALGNVDLRAEVLGFHPDQVVAYLEADPNMCSSQLEYVLDARDLNEEHHPTCPVKFFQRYKYKPHYDVFWRLVTGIIATEHENHLERFFAALEQEPFDLLGPAHQRLTMHCLAEVDSNIKLSTRSKLELRLSKWAQFEYEFGNFARLAEEPEFPEQSLYTTLNAAFVFGCSDATDAILGQVETSRRQLSERVESLIFALFMKFRVSEARAAAANIFRCRVAATNILRFSASLSMRTARRMKALLEDKERSELLRIDTATILWHHPTLVKGMLVDLEASLKSKDQFLVIAAAMALGSQVNPSAEIEGILLALLESNARAIRHFASRALAVKKTISEKTQSFLLQMVKEHPNEEIQELAAKVLQQRYDLSDTILTEVAEAIIDVDGSIFADLVLDIVWGQKGRELPGPIQEILVEKFQCVPGLRFAIAGIFARQKTLSEKASTTLRQVISDRSNAEFHRMYAIISFKAVLVRPWPIVVALTNLVTDGSQSSILREPSALILRHELSSSPAATEDFHRLLEDDSQNIQYYALFALMIRDFGQLTTAKLFTLLQHRDYDCQLSRLAVQFLKNSMNLGRSEEKELVRIMSAGGRHNGRPSWRGCLPSGQRSLQHGAAEVLAGQTRLSDQAQNSLLRRIRDLEYGWWVRYLAATALGSQLGLAKAALLLQSLDRRVLDDVCEIASVMALAPALVNIILGLVGSHADAEQLTETAVPASGHVKLITGLYERLLNRSFTEQVTLCVYDNVCIIDQPQGHHKVPLNDFELDSLRSHIASRQQLINEKKYKLWCRYG